ncbi:inhibitor of apoptosis protein-like [Lineus longissimus]|uniref:inhibitor of apoptosis protein-like n=1 Tax=Lineus longissimus TaxID=88925 RepID=UPI00315D3FAD
MAAFLNQSWSSKLQPFGHNQGPGTNEHAGAAATRMKDVMRRLASFSVASSLPINLSSITLADKGFYYDKITKRVVCVDCESSFDIPKHMNDLFDQHRAKSPMCKPEEQKVGRYMYGQSGEKQSNGVIKRWQNPQRLSSSGDELFDEVESINDDEMYASGPQKSGSHPELSRLDLYLQRGPFGMITSTNDEPANATAMGECSVPISTFLRSPAATERIQRPIFDARNAKIRDFETYESRLSSFDLWPVRKWPTKEELADCGFIFIADDLCQCFNCELILHEWQENDNVWKEHAKYSIDCEYVLFRKGEDFVSSVRNEMSAPGFRDERMSQRREGSVEERGAESQIANQYLVDGRVVMARLDMDMARYVIGMGYSEDEVGSVIQERLMQTGADFQNATEMVKVLDGIRNKSRPPPSVQFHRRPANSEGTTSAVVSNPGSLRYNSIVGTPSSQTTPLPMESRSSEEFPLEGYEQTPVVSPTFGPRVNSSGDLREINEENESLHDLELCSICVDKDRDTVFVPCHHLICCRTCAARLRECPICRVRITDRLAVNE